MKRRDFIAVAAGSVASSLVPRLAGAASKPCPPPTLSVTGITPVTTECGPQGAAPSWFVSMPDRTWTAVAGATGARLVDVYHGASLGFGNTFPTMTKAWTGGCVDQDRGELIFAANGGHGDYAGNEVYACSVRSENPRWYRLTDPTPAALVKALTSDSSSVSTSNLPSGQGFSPGAYAAMFGDGRMRPVHGYHSCLFANGRVWYPYQAAPTGIGYSTSHVWSFDRNASGVPTAPNSPSLPWANDPGPWKWLGATDSGSRDSSTQGINYGTAPPAALDPVTGLIWIAHANQATRVWSSIDTRSEAVRRSDVVNGYAPNSTQDTRWAAVVTDPSGQDRWRMWVAPAPGANGLIVLNLKAGNPYAADAWAIRPVSDLGAISTSGRGAVYDGRSRAVLIGDPVSLPGGRLLKLSVPVRSDGTYDASATWPVSTIAPAAGSLDPSSGVVTGNNGAWSKFNLIQDMGNGQSALVVCMEVDKPTFVYKLPSAGV
jgi:hypothetical protein